MTVEEVINKLKIYDKDTEVVFESYEFGYINIKTTNKGNKIVIEENFN